MLVVCDSHDASWLDAVDAASPVDVLLLGVGAPAFARRHADALRRRVNVRLLEVAPLAAAANDTVSRFLVDLVHRLPSFDLGGRRLGEYLQEREQNLWWSLEISEKSAFRGHLARRLYALALIAETLRASRYGRVELQLGDAALAATIRRALPTMVPGIDGARVRSASFAMRYWLRAAAAIGRFVAVRALCTWIPWKAPAIAPGGLALFTLFPYWWTSSFGAQPTERFFSAPPRAAAHYVAWVTSPLRIWQHRKAFRTTLGQTGMLPLQRFVRWRDGGHLLSLARYRRLVALRRALKHLRVSFGAFDISSLVAEDITGSMCDSELFFDQLVQAGLTNYLTSTKPGALAYRVEGQPWEHALLRAAKTGGTPVVGFFHSMFGKNYAALRFAEGELAGADAGAGPRPVAPRMLVPGAAIERNLVQDGYPAEAIARCGPQRHAAFLRFLHHRPARAQLRRTLGLPVDRPVYFIAIAIVAVETEGLFACLEQALSGLDAFHVLIKTHPNRPEGDASMRAAVAAVGEARVTFVPPGADMYEYLAASDTMITIGSTVAFEAMALDVMPVVYEHSATFAVLSLRDFERALYVVDSADGMRTALAEIRDGAPPALARKAAWRQTVADVFGDTATPLDTQLAAALAQVDIMATHQR